MGTKRSYGTGSLYTRTDARGRVTFYGKWRVGKQQINRRIGFKRAEGAKFGLTQTEAEAELRRMMHEVRAAREAPVSERGVTLEDLGRRYVQHLEHIGRKRSTVTAVKSVLDNWLVPHFGDRALDKITPADVRDLMRKMEAGGVGRRKNKPVGPKSIRNYIGTLSALYNYAERKELASGNPARLVDLPGVESNEDIRFLEVAEVGALVGAAIPGPYRELDRALYLTAALTGLRQGELVALRWRDVDWSAGLIRVRQNYVLGEFGTPKSKRSTRSVPLADVVGGELERFYRASGEPEDDALVFADPLSGGPLSKAAILRRFRSALRAARLDEAHTFHHLRHSYGTRMASVGTPMRRLQEYMGHRDIETTQRYADYAPAPDHEREITSRAFAGLEIAASLGPDRTALTPNPQ